MSKVPLVHRKNLRNIDDARLFETRITGFKQDIAWVGVSIQVPSQSADDHRINIATIPGVVLDHYGRTSVARLGLIGLVEIYPEDVTLYRATIRH